MSAPKWADLYGIDPMFKSTQDLALEQLRNEHWLIFNDGREVVGCHCGFEADNDSDCGWGDSVVEHLFRVAMDAQ